LLFSKQIAIYSCSWTFLGGKRRTSKGIPNVQKGKKQDLTPFLPFQEKSKKQDLTSFLLVIPAEAGIQRYLNVISYVFVFTGFPPTREQA